MSKRNISERLFALIMAGLFLLTAVATGVAVIVSSIHSNKSSSTNSASTSSTTSSTSTTKLEGTKLVGFTPTSSVPSLEIKDVKVGTGAAVDANSTVGVQYTGAVAATGIIFQSSLDTSTAPVSFAISDVIKGFGEGLIGMKVGGDRQILIPASLAYGASPPQGIPDNAALVFDVTLISVKQ